MGDGMLLTVNQVCYGETGLVNLALEGNGLYFCKKNVAPTRVVKGLDELIEKNSVEAVIEITNSWNVDAFGTDEFSNIMESVKVYVGLYNKSVAT